jgi:transcriptional regulator with XRE-family HTH domain
MREIAVLVGLQIRELRKRKGLTQEKVAERASVNATYYGRVERGDANVSLELLAAIAEALETPIEELVTIDAPRDPGEITEELICALRALPEKDIRRLHRMYPLLFPSKP